MIAFAMILEDTSTRLSDFGAVRIDGLHCNVGLICHPLTIRIYTIWSCNTPCSLHSGQSASRAIEVTCRLSAHHVSCDWIMPLPLVTNIICSDGWAFLVI